MLNSVPIYSIFLHNIKIGPVVYFKTATNLLETSCCNTNNWFLVAGYNAADSAKENMVMSHNIHRFAFSLLFYISYL